MKPLEIPEAIRLQLIDAAHAGAPLEVCGLLAGREGRVETYYPMTNADASEDHFTMVPEEQFAAVKDMRDKGTKMLAIWHSHPASPARMSDEDIRLAFTPDVIYVISSLVAPAAEALRGYVMIEGVPEEVAIHEI